MDMLFGDPHFLPHPVRLIGKLITCLEKLLLGKADKRDKKSELIKGGVLAFTIVIITVLATVLILNIVYSIHIVAGLAIETVMTYQIMAAKSLRDESMKVYRALKDGDVNAARKAVSMIVGRDTKVLDAEGIIRAAVETVAENTSDGVIAPMFYTFLGGPAAGMFYKAVNTMDSMIGYKNDKYIYFGRAAARLDDLVNFIPARISAHLMILAAYIGGKRFSGRQAYEIYKRDRYKHASPNSAQTEAACAGALGIRLAGAASYFGIAVEKPYIGDALREVSYEDIRYAGRLMYITAGLGEILCIIIMTLLLQLPMFG